MHNWYTETITFRHVFVMHKNTFTLVSAGIFLYLCPANERRRYNVMSSLIGLAHTQNDPVSVMSGIIIFINSPQTLIQVN